VGTTLLEDWMEIIVAAIMCVLIAVLPTHKGYNPALWFLAARFISLIVLALVASARKESLPAEEKMLSASNAGEDGH
jgi:hypothetical protein